MVPLRVMAIIIKFVIILDPRHGGVLLAAQPRGGSGRTGGGAAEGAAVGVAATNLEIVVLANKGLVIVVGSVLPTLGGP